MTAREGALVVVRIVSGEVWPKPEGALEELGLSPWPISTGP